MVRLRGSQAAVAGGAVTLADTGLQTKVRDCEPSCGPSSPALVVTRCDTAPGGT